MAERVEAVVIGAGVIGLATARALALAGHEVVVLEAGPAIGHETSSRNSEVIHAGIYYPPGSLKAKFCVDGRRALYDYCREHGVGHTMTGKLIVAADDGEAKVLERLRQTSLANGMTGDDSLQWLDRAAARRHEPAVACVAALFSPASGIIDSHGLMLAYRGDAEAHGAAVALNCRVHGAERRGDGFRLDVATAEGAMALECWLLVNAAGFAAPTVAASIDAMPRAAIPPSYYAKGNYFVLAGRTPFRRLVYPVPSGTWLGIHYTVDLAGQGRFGPDVEYVERIDYTVDPGRAGDFYASIRRYWPGLPDGALHPGYAGIRPKIAGPGEPARDFLVQGPHDHGIAGLVNFFGIESPGLTASLSLAEHAVTLLRDTA